MKVAIVITTYLEELKPYLDACMRSIRNLDSAGLEVSTLIVSPSGYSPALESPELYAGVWGLHVADETGGRDYSNAYAMNEGVAKVLEDKPDVILYANDDVIFTRSSLKRMLAYFSDFPRAVIMPVSNDQQNRYAVQVGMCPGPYRLEEKQEYLTAMLNHESIYPRGLMFQHTLCTYVMAFRPQVWLDVGGQDESFAKGGPIDIDWCLRCMRKGYQPAIALDAIVWHAGGVSADKTHDEATRIANSKMFERKWAGLAAE